MRTSVVNFILGLLIVASVASVIYGAMLKTPLEYAFVPVALALAAGVFITVIEHDRT
jgi:uncharacterized membrane protein YccC